VRKRRFVKIEKDAVNQTILNSMYMEKSCKFTADGESGFRPQFFPSLKVVYSDVLDQDRK